MRLPAVARYCLSGTCKATCKLHQELGIVVQKVVLSDFEAMVSYCSSRRARPVQRGRALEAVSFGHPKLEASAPELVGT